MNEHNPQINKILEGCGIIMLTSDKRKCNCGFQPAYRFDKILCDNCKSLLKGIIIAQENEVEFLRRLFKEVTSKDDGYIIHERLKALQESNIKLREVTK